MKRALLAAIAAAAVVLSASPASAQIPVPSIPRQVVVFLVDDMSFEQLMAVPEIRALAREGGSALMSSRTVQGDDGPGHVLTFGTGVRSAVPFASVRVRPRGPDALAVVGWRQIVATNKDRSTPGLLGSVLKAHGLVAGTDSNEGSLITADRSGLTAAVRADAPLVVQGPQPFGNQMGIELRRSLLALPGRRLLVIVVDAAPSAAMTRIGDELAPIVMAEGAPSQLFDGAGPMRTLTSDTTRRDGVVSNEDVAPTILHFLGIPVPSEMNGAPIRMVDQAPPFALHQRHLEERRLTVPIQIAVGLAVTVLGLLALFILWRKPRLPDAWARRAAVIPLAILPLGVASLAAGGLPHITYPWVIPFLILVPLAVALLALRLRDRGSLVPPLAIGVAVLAFYVVEALRGWPDTLTTLSGGSALDGVRFYGMGNVEIGKILGASLWVAAFLSPFSGFALLVAAGLFCGFPDLGANFGACITLFAAAGLWLPLRRRGRLTWRGLGFAALVVIGGLVVVVAANLIWSHAPTHGARFVRNAPHRGLGHLVAFARERLATGIRQLVHSPLLWITTLGLLPELYFVLRPTPLLKDAFSRYPAWRDGILVMVLASAVALVANDSGAAAASWGFGVAVASIFYLPLVEETWRTVGRRVPETASEPVTLRRG